MSRVFELGSSWGLPSTWAGTSSEPCPLRSVTDTFSKRGPQGPASSEPWPQARVHCGPEPAPSPGPPTLILPSQGTGSLTRGPQPVPHLAARKKTEPQRPSCDPRSAASTRNREEQDRSAHVRRLLQGAPRSARGSHHLKNKPTPNTPTKKQRVFQTPACARPPRHPSPSQTPNDKGTVGVLKHLLHHGIFHC